METDVDKKKLIWFKSMDRGRMVGMVEGGRMERLVKRIPKVENLSSIDCCLICWLIDEDYQGGEVAASK